MSDATLSSDRKEHLPVLARMTRDMRQAAAIMSDQEARFLVDSYYSMQTSRIREAGRIRAMQKKAKAEAEGKPIERIEREEVTIEEEETKSDVGEPHTVIAWLFDNSWLLETAVKGALQKYAEASPVGRWAMGIHGIGPVISAGLISYLDPTWPTVGHIYSFCGLNPTVQWKKGKKRPWSASAKQVAFKVGHSMMMRHKNPKCIYGQLYAARKRKEALINERGGFADVAKQTLAEKDFDKDTEAYKAYIVGKLPKGRIELRARRYSTKLFLSHWHAVAHWHATGQAVPLPYAIMHKGHAHYLPPPNFDPATFPVAEKLRPVRQETLSEALERQLRHITTIEEAVRLAEFGEEPIRGDDPDDDDE